MSSSDIELKIQDQLNVIKGYYTYNVMALCIFAYLLVKLICATINESIEEHE